MDYTLAQQRAFDTIDANLQIIACACAVETGVVSASVANIPCEHHSDYNDSNKPTDPRTAP